MMILFTLVMMGLFEAMVAVPLNLAQARPQTSGLECENPVPKIGSNEFAICEAFEIMETGDWKQSDTGDGNGDEIFRIADDNYEFTANWEPEPVPKSKMLEAFDFIEDLSLFNEDPDEDVFVASDSKTLETDSDGVTTSTGAWEIPEKGWKGTFTLVAKGGKITSSTAWADDKALAEIKALDKRKQRGKYAPKK